MSSSTAEAEPVKAQSDVLVCTHCGATVQEGGKGQLAQPVDMDEFDIEVINRFDLMSFDEKAYLLSNRRDANAWQKWLDENGFDYIVCTACGHSIRTESEES